MTKKNIFSKLFVALVVLTLISCCFLGSTFARYTSEGTGSASVEVANWKIDVTGGGTEGATNVAFGQLSPSAEDGTGRVNSTGRILVATIQNNGEVNASITVRIGDLTIYGLNADGVTASGTEVAVWGDYDEEHVSSLFTLNLYYATQEGAQYATVPVTSGTAIYDSLAPKATYYIYAEVVWASEDDTAGDALDTWVGQNVGKLSWALTYTAVQASEQPTA